MKRIIYTVFSVLKKIFFFFRVVVTLEFGKSTENDTPSKEEQTNDGSASEVSVPPTRER